MIRKSFGDVEFLQFPLLCNCPELVHGSFLRHGGVSQGAFGSLNFSSFQGDLRENVSQNLSRALSSLKIKNIKYSNLSHEKNIYQVTAPSQMTLEWECDGLATQLKETGLMVTHADCQAAIFYDPTQKALSVVHCGWRGNVQNIYQEAVLKMGHFYGSKPENLLVGISPSLGPEKAQFINYKTELPQWFWQYQKAPLYFDLWEISRQQLLEQGVLPHHIEIAGLCTYINENDCFSYRRQGGGSGRHATIASIR